MSDLRFMLYLAKNVTEPVEKENKNFLKCMYFCFKTFSETYINKFFKEVHILINIGFFMFYQIIIYKRGVLLLF